MGRETMETGKIMNSAVIVTKLLCGDRVGRSAPVQEVANDGNATDKSFAPIAAILAHCEEKTGAMMQSAREAA